MNVLLTGATGFVGKALIAELASQDVGVVAAVRHLVQELPEDVLQVEIGDLFELESAQALQGVDTVIHCAARAHVTKSYVADPLAEYRKVNVEGTLNLAGQIANAGIKRFVFISSIGVMGNNNNKPFLESDTPNPQSAYAISKYEAEQGLLAIAKDTDMEVVIIRPPLVYGPNAPGNFARLLQWISKGVPLPLGSVYNQRSLVALDNLVNFIALCANHNKTPKAVNEVFLISDNEDISTTELLYKVGSAFGKKPVLIPIPVGIMKCVARLIGKGDEANRLFGSLRVDSSKSRELLGWHPVISMDEQLKKTAETYVKSLSSISSGLH
ncbi:UDP-glucose 4-epimerase family protein [Candidatus Vondammii sp. HM_W22]|uniref:UDP-glucose 4-epimerase family protein n=1 Tax=Candidatus Vondammii sp. HM_W22 TaxID=2687299 RepID=UPI001F12E091|nr:SDR family oxidoreductase [Candidatus Vondammii sp. HM_W22]